MRFQYLSVPIDLVAVGIPTSGDESIHLIIDTQSTTGVNPAVVARCAGFTEANQLLTVLNA